jgi:RNase P subunit RPR2
MNLPNAYGNFWDDVLRKTQAFIRRLECPKCAMPMRHRRATSRNPNNPRETQPVVEFTCGCGLTMVFSRSAVLAGGEATVVSGAIYDVLYAREKEQAERALLGESNEN